MGIAGENLLDILTEERLCNTLEHLLCENELYQSAQKEVKRSIDKLKKAKLSKEQHKQVDKVLSAANFKGTVYGEAAYKQGFYDGMKLMSELHGLIQSDKTISIE